MNVIKNIIKMLGSLREMIVKSAIIDNSLFSRIGQVEGIQKIVDHVFENIKYSSMNFFYQNLNMCMIK